MDASCGLVGWLRGVAGQPRGRWLRPASTGPARSQHGAPQTTAPAHGSQRDWVQGKGGPGGGLHQRPDPWVPRKAWTFSGRGLREHVGPPLADTPRALAAPPAARWARLGRAHGATDGIQSPRPPQAGLSRGWACHLSPPSVFQVPAVITLVFPLSRRLLMVAGVRGRKWAEGPLTDLKGSPATRAPQPSPHPRGQRPIVPGPPPGLGTSVLWGSPVALAAPRASTEGGRRKARAVGAGGRMLT